MSGFYSGIRYYTEFRVGETHMDKKIEREMETGV